jgi:hypothetical protein
MKLARLLVGVGTCVFAMATSAAAQIYIDGSMDGGPSLAQAKAAGTSKVTSGVTIKRVAGGGGFPEGTYGCTAQISSAPQTCVHFTGITLLSPSGTVLAQDSESPMCQVANLRAEVYLDANAESGTYVCSVEATGNDWVTGDPVSGDREFFAYWGDGGGSFQKAKSAATRFITPLKALDE